MIVTVTQFAVDARRLYRRWAIIGKRCKNKTNDSPNPII